MFEVIPEGSLNRVARDMNIIVKGVFVFDSEEEMAFLQDRLIHDILWDGKNALEHFEIEKGSDLSEMERKILEGMKGAYFSLFEVVGTVSGETVQLSDLLSGNQVEMMDISLSSTAPEGALLATRIFKVEDIPAAKVASLDEVAVDPQVLHQKMILTMEHPLGGEIKLAGNPIKMEGISEKEFTPPPTLNQNQHQILSELLGYSDEKIRGLREEEVENTANRLQHIQKVL